MRRGPLLLIVMDGWGLGPPGRGNAIDQANTPTFDAIRAQYPFTELIASGEAVGVRSGQIGNSEVGHLNLGAGRVVAQQITYIDEAIASGEFYANSALVGVFDRAATRGGRVHLIGLISDAGVHAAQSHNFALIEMARRRKFPGDRLLVHAVTDGRDALPNSGLQYIEQLEGELTRQGLGRIATVIGRYLAMDRDGNWGRVQKAYNNLIKNNGIQFESAAAAVRAAYDRGETDEFVPPAVIGSPEGMAEGDEVLIFNFRSDRMRQLVRAFHDESFDEFDRGPRPQVGVTTLTRYSEGLDCPVAFGPHPMANLLGDVLSTAGLKQLRLAETEKYAHVTYFFNGGEEAPVPGEERVLIPSPKVATYDLQPQMSQPEVTARAVEAIAARTFDVGVINFANADMVGHTGNLEATIRAVEAVDRGVGAILEAQAEVGGVTMITSDHGNAERMVEAAGGGSDTAHTTHPVPLILVGDGVTDVTLDAGGRLCDVAPTMLTLLDLKQPEAMTGRSLLSS